MQAYKYSVSGTKWNQPRYPAELQDHVSISELIAVPSRDPGAHQTVNRATKGPHAMLSLLKIATSLARMRSHPRSPREGAAVCPPRHKTPSCEGVVPCT